MEEEVLLCEMFSQGSANGFAWMNSLVSTCVLPLHVLSHYFSQNCLDYAVYVSSRLLVPKIRVFIDHFC